MTAEDLLSMQKKMAEEREKERERQDRDEDEEGEEGVGEGESDAPSALDSLLSAALSVVKGAPQQGDVIFDPNLPEKEMPEEAAGARRGVAPRLTRLRHSKL